jgi:hypothetical protein
LEIAIAMIPVVENLKIFGLSPELYITSEPLPTKESSVIGIIEAFYNGVPPRLSDWDKNDFDPHQQAKSQDYSKRSRMAVAAPETQFVVELEEIRYAHGFPATNQGGGYG